MISGLSPNKVLQKGHMREVLWHFGLAEAPRLISEERSKVFGSCKSSTRLMDCVIDLEETEMESLPSHFFSFPARKGKPDIGCGILILFKVESMSLKSKA